MAIKIPLTKGYFAIVDDCDAHLVEQKWTADVAPNGRVYAYRHMGTKKTGRSKVYLHRVITGAERGRWVDHADRDGLNCTRANLRVAAPSDNHMNSIRRRTNTSGFKGVILDRRPGRGWYAEIKHKGARRCSKYFTSPQEAAAAYDAMAKQMAGEFARGNGTNGIPNGN